MDGIEKETYKKRRRGRMSWRGQATVILAEEGEWESGRKTEQRRNAGDEWWVGYAVEGNIFLGGRSGDATFVVIWHKDWVIVGGRVPIGKTDWGAHQCVLQRGYWWPIRAPCHFDGLGAGNHGLRPCWTVWSDLPTGHLCVRTDWSW
jgi:hypothetical protein